MRNVNTLQLIACSQSVKIIFTDKSVAWNWSTSSNKKESSVIANHFSLVYISVLFYSLTLIIFSSDTCSYLVWCIYPVAKVFTISFSSMIWLTFLKKSHSATWRHNHFRYSTNNICHLHVTDMVQWQKNESSFNNIVTCMGSWRRRSDW
jgi:hypothetical protein